MHSSCCRDRWCLDGRYSRRPSAHLGHIGIASNPRITEAPSTETRNTPENARVSRVVVAVAEGQRLTELAAAPNIVADEGVRLCSGGGSRKRQIAWGSRVWLHHSALQSFLTLHILFKPVRPCRTYCNPQATLPPSWPISFCATLARVCPISAVHPV